MTPALAQSLRKHALPILCLTLAPILVALIHDDWLFTPIEYLDPWYNVGFFLNYFDPQFMPGHYKESRMSWLAPGYLAYQLFGPLAANYVLHLGSLIAAAVLVYLTLARLVSRNAAFIAAALLCAYYPFHNSGGWDYQTTPAGAFYALTLYLLTRGAQSKRPGPWLVGAGAAFGGAFHADILFVNTALGLAALYLAAAARKPSVKELATVAGWGLLGFVMLTQVLSAVAISAGRSPMFYKPIIDIVFSYTADPHRHMGAWWLPTSSGWFLKRAGAAYLLPLAGIALAGLAALTGYAFKWSRRDKVRAEGADVLVQMALIGQFVFLFGLWCLWQAIGHVALQPDYFAYPLIVPAFVALGAMIGPAGWRELIALAAAMAALMLSSLIGPAGLPLWDWRLAYGTLVVVIVAGIAIAAVWPRSRTVAALAAAITFLFAYPSMSPHHPMWSQIRPRPGVCGSPKQLFVELTRINSMLLRDRPDAETAWLWNGPLSPPDSMCDIPLDAFRWALVSSGVLPLYPGAQAAAIDLPVAAAHQPAYNDRVVAIVRDKAELGPLVARFSQAKERLVMEREEPIKFKGRWAYLAIYRLKS